MLLNHTCPEKKRAVNRQISRFCAHHGKPKSQQCRSSTALQTSLSQAWAFGALVVPSLVFSRLAASNTALQASSSTHRRIDSVQRCANKHLQTYANVLQTTLESHLDIWPFSQTSRLDSGQEASRSSQLACSTKCSKLWAAILPHAASTMSNRGHKVCPNHHKNPAAFFMANSQNVILFQVFWSPLVSAGHNGSTSTVKRWRITRTSKALSSSSSLRTRRSRSTRRLRMGSTCKGSHKGIYKWCYV